MVRDVEHVFLTKANDCTNAMHIIQPITPWYNVHDVVFVLRMLRSLADQEVVEITQPSEPECILWENAEQSDTARSVRIGLARLLVLAVYVLCYLTVSELKKISSLVLSVGLGVLDTLLPTLLVFITDIEVRACVYVGVFVRVCFNI